MKKLYIVFILAVLVTLTSQVLANPFSDVPFSHWAYDAVKNLTDKGIMIGMPDGTFKGEKGVNRYQLAVTLARALEKLPSMKGNVDAIDLRALERLTIEFADELALLGVKVMSLEDGLQVVRDDITAIKAGKTAGCRGDSSCGDTISITGDSWLHIDDVKFATDDVDDDLNTYYLIGLNLAAPIDEGVRTFVRIENDPDITSTGQRFGADLDGATFSIDVAYIAVDGLFDLADVKIGRQWIGVGHYIVMQDKYDGIIFSKKIDDLAVDFFMIDQVNQPQPGNDNGFNLKGIDLKRSLCGHDAEVYYVVNNQNGANTGDLVNYGLSLDGAVTEDMDYLFEYCSYDDNVPGANNQEGDFWIFGIDYSFNEKVGIKLTYGEADEEYLPVGVNYFPGIDELYGTMNPGYGVDNDEGVTNASGYVIGIKDTLAKLYAQLSEKTDGFLVYEKVEANDTTAAATLYSAANGSVPEYSRFTIGFNHQYAPNTTFGIRYDTVEYDGMGIDPADAQNKDIDNWLNSGGWTRIRVQMMVKF